MTFYRVSVDRQQFYNPGGVSGIQRLGSDRPTGPFLVHLSAEHNISFDITSSHLTVTNGTLGTMTKRTDSPYGWDIVIIPNSEATSVSVAIAEDAFTHNLKGNQSATKSWSVADDDAPFVLSAVFTSDNADKSTSGPYNQGEHIDLTLNYSEQVNVTHTAGDANKPYITFDVAGTEKNAVYLDGSGTEFIRFRYTIESGFPSSGRAALISASVNMPTGSAIKETKSASPQDALTALPPAPIYMETPRPTTDSDVTTPPVGAPGDTYQHRVRFNQAVKVRGTPGIALEFSLAGQTSASKIVCSRYVKHISDTELLFRYVVPVNHGLNLALTHSTKHGMCASNSSRITNASGTQDATHYLYSVWKRVVRIDVGESKRIWFGLSSILPITVTIAFTNSHPSLITLGASSFSFTPQNALTPQGLTITTSDDEQHRGQSAQILYGIPEYSITGRDFLTVVLEEEINVFTTTVTAPSSPTPPNLARNPVSWSPQGGMQALPFATSEISANAPSGASGSLDLSDIQLSVSEGRQTYSRGYFSTTRVFEPVDRQQLFTLGPDREVLIKTDEEGRFTVVGSSPLLWIRLWHIYERASTGINTVELLGDAFFPRLSNRLAEPIEVCLPIPADADPERLRLAARGRLDTAWTVLDTTVNEDKVCADTTIVAWLVLVESE